MCIDLSVLFCLSQFYHLRSRRRHGVCRYFIEPCTEPLRFHNSSSLCEIRFHCQRCWPGLIDCLHRTCIVTQPCVGGGRERERERLILVLHCVYAVPLGQGGGRIGVGLDVALKRLWYNSRSGGISAHGMCRDDSPDCAERPSLHRSPVRCG
jgi:hypothetical protein